MVKKFLLLFFFLALAPLFLHVNAQQASQRWVCLNADRADVHAATLTVDPGHALLANSPTYIVECVAMTGTQPQANQPNCTTGNSALDKAIFNRDNYSLMAGPPASKANPNANGYNYGFESATVFSDPKVPEPLKSGAGGVTLVNVAGQEMSSFVWRSHSIDVDRRWLALNYMPPTTGGGTGNATSQQLGDFTFDAAINKSSCTKINWDPYGRVFDSSTLDPVSGATVTLLLQRGNGTFTPMTPGDLLGGNLINPQVTQEDGRFSFVVPDGTYELQVTEPGYNFPVQLADIQSNYTKIYSDIYPIQTGEQIVQKGAIQHRDVPITSSSTPQSNDAKLMEYFYDLNKSNSTITVQGRVSHPFAQIKAYSLHPDPVTNQMVRYKLLTQTPVQADAQGSFTLTIDQSNFEPGENFGDITVEKVDLTNPANLVQRIKNWFFSLLGKPVNAQVTLASNFRFEPIPNYLEGYAYDSQGKVIPNAVVSVVLSFSNMPSYQTTADGNGYFKIGSELLPSMPYRIDFKSPSGQTVDTTTSKFIIDNQKLIADSQVNTNEFKTSQGQVITPQPATGSNNKNYNKPANQSGNNGSSPSSQSLTKTLGSNSFLPLVLAILVTLFIAVAVAVFYFRKRSSF
ncbi:hypothetical protein M1328_00795 [Patescibacteria group bacterium]|nr:hypothetical protein [Patescibacteria group bacterium]